MYILNINKSYGTNTPQILGRVADLPYMDFEFMFKDGTKPVDLTGCTVEFRGLTSTDNKIISTESVTPKDSKNGTINFKVPKNFYSAPGAFKRAYFAIKKNGRIDTTQDIIIHVLDSVDMDAEDAQNVIDAVDKIIASVEKQVKDETNRLIQQIKNDTASTIADSNKKLSELDKQINDFKNNTNSTINSINGYIDELNKSVGGVDTKVRELNNRVSQLEKMISDNNLVKKPEFLKLKDDFDSLTYTGINYISGTSWESEFGTSFKILDDKRSELEFKTNKGNEWARISNKSPNHIEWLEGKKYTLSFYIKVDNPNTTNRIRALISSKVGSGNITGTISITPTSEYQLISRTFEYNDTGFEDDIYFQIFSDYSSNAGEDLTIWIKDVVLTDGSKVHNWSPSIYDVVYVWQMDELLSKVHNLEKIVTALGGS